MRSIVPVFIPHLGCPHLCIFCNQKKISGTLKAPSRDEIISLVDEYRSADFSKEYELAFFGGSFTSISLEKQRYYLETAAKLKAEGKIIGIRFSTRPDAIDSNILKMAKEYKVDTIELGVQSLNSRVLTLSERGHTVLDVEKAVKLIKENGFNLGLQVMPGLMGDDEKTIAETIAQTISLKPDFVRIYPTVIIKETKLAEYYYSGNFKPIPLSKMVEIVAGAYLSFIANNIKVIRMGLQAVDNLTEEKDLVAGPYHPAFGELVFGEIYRQILLSFIEKHSIRDGILTVKANSGDFSKILGQKKTNKDFLKREYNLELKVFSEELCDKNEIEISFGDYSEIKTINGFALERKYNIYK